METIKKNIRRPKMLNPEERKTHNMNEYNKNFQRNAPYVHCNECGIDVKKYSYLNHTRTLKHQFKACKLKLKQITELTNN